MHSERRSPDAVLCSPRVQVQAVPHGNQPVNSSPASPAGPPSASIDDPPAEQQPQPSFCQRVFCCAKAPAKQDRKGGAGDGRNRSHPPGSVPMQQPGQNGAAGGNQNHSRVDTTPSVSATGVTLHGGHGGPGNQQSTIGLNSRDGGITKHETAAPTSAASAYPAQPPIPQPTTPLRDSNNIVTPPPAKYLLGPLPPADVGKKCLVLDLDETLVHSSFKPIPNADFVISIELESVIHRVYVRKRPGVDHFMRVVGEKFEVVIFTASLSKYADPLLDILDRGRVVKARLFREACVQHYGSGDLHTMGKHECRFRCRFA